MRKIFILFFFLTSSVFAQNVPLCDDGMGGFKPCLIISPNYLPVVPISRGGTGATGTGALLVGRGRFFGGDASGVPRFQLLQRDMLPGLSFDFSTTPGPMFDVTKAVGTGPQLIGRFPGRSGTFNRIYVGEDVMYFAFNASTGGGDWTKDSTAVPSSVVAMRYDGEVQRMTQGDPTVSMWSAPQFSLRQVSNGLLLNSKSPQIAVAGGTVCGGSNGDIYPFPVQWPVPYETAPTSVTAGSDITSSGTNIASVSGVSRYGAVLNVRRVTSDPCVSWVGYVSVSN